jgi:DNA-binding GntR family transcriptional regulator
MSSEKIGAGTAVADSTAAAPPRRSNQSVSEQTYEALFGLITTRQIEPGDVIEERRLAGRFEVSRTPMRAAISRLLGEGVLQQLSNGIVVVREVGLTEYLELLAVRLLLESEAAALAAAHAPLPVLARIEQRLQDLLRAATDEHGTGDRLDDEIHEVVVKHCGNGSLAKFISEIHRRIRMRNLANAPERLIPACREHLELVHALQGRDAHRSRQAMVEHLLNVRASYLRVAGIVPHLHANG